MSSLTVWCFSTPLGADTGEVGLKRLEEQGALVVHDAVALIWMPGAPEPTIRHLRHDAVRAGVTGAFWGSVIGMLALSPVAGAVVGSAAGSVVAKLRRGVGDDFVAQVGEQISPGTSALFVLSSGARADLVGPAIAAMEATLLHAELGDEVDPELRALLDPARDDPKT
jgi:uncharacterized membrane protein